MSVRYGLLIALVSLAGCASAPVQPQLPKTVYARFVRNEPSMGGLFYDAQTFTDDIILDLTAPVVKTATSEVAANVARRLTSPRKHQVRVRAVDKVSGVAQVQFARKKAKPSGLRAYRKVFAFKKAPRFVRVVDLAGNYSAWKRIA